MLRVDKASVLFRRPRRAASACARQRVARHSRSRIRGRARHLGLRKVDAAQRHGGLPAAVVRIDHAQRASRSTAQAPSAASSSRRTRLLPWKTVAENVALGLKFAGVGRKERARARARAAAPRRPAGLRRRRALRIVRRHAPARRHRPRARPRSRHSAHGRAVRRARQPDARAMQELLVDVWARTGKQIFFITHSIEEALFLGTHLIVMSPRPGRIVARYDLDFVNTFARDRDARAVKNAPPSGRLRDEIRAIVHETRDSQERRRMTDVVAADPSAPRAARQRARAAPCQDARLRRSASARPCRSASRPASSFSPHGGSSPRRVSSRTSSCRRPREVVSAAVSFFQDGYANASLWEHVGASLCAS